MSKAYMSQAYWTRAEAWPGRAEQEARAILRSVEPLDGYPSNLTLTIWTRDYDAYRVACDCLAEALAAFVADDKPAAEQPACPMCGCVLYREVGPCAGSLKGKE